MLCKYPQFVNTRLERNWRSQLIEQQRLDRLIRGKTRDTGYIDNDCLAISDGSFSSEWTTNKLPFKEDSHIIKNDINLHDCIGLNFHKDLGFNVVATKKIPTGSMLGYLNGVVMEYTLKMYNTLHHICGFNTEALVDENEGLVPLFNIYDGRKYDGSSDDLFVGLISTVSGSSLKHINSTCNADHKNVQRWVVPYGNSLNIYYCSIKPIKAGDSILDDYMFDSAKCKCSALGINCVNMN